ncbi:hypothetical protein [Streptomyces sp. NPDC018947]|uniref:hypothetical protein n=1 Tax=Streptomyces sp. NPDC018947 TaxID=3365054 RepID=UPI0037BA0239
MSQELLDGRFRIGHVIGKGNMGEVHRAEDLQAAEGTPERTVAVKTILRRRTGTRIDTGADPKAIKFPLMLPRVSPSLTAALIASQSSLVFDCVCRQKVGAISVMLFIWKQLPVPHPDDLAPHTPFLIRRTLELLYTSWEMEPLAKDLGDTGAPFTWNEDRRAQLRAELDAYFLHLYGVSAEDADYILESFQTENGGLKNNEIAKYGEYRTKRLVLTEYNRMAAAGLTLETPLIDGENYTSTLTPPPGHGPRHEGAAE